MMPLLYDAAAFAGDSEWMRTAAAHNRYVRAATSGVSSTRSVKMDDRLLKHRIGDRRIIRLIQKRLDAGALKKNAHARKPLFSCESSLLCTNFPVLWGTAWRWGYQAATAACGSGSLAGWNLCPKPEQSVPL